MNTRILAATLAATAAFGLSGCVTDDGYGYGGVSLGYGGGYYSGYPYYGWYDDYYYPGAGYYVYDRGGGRHAWNDGQRRYWEGRRGNGSRPENWTGFRGNRNGGAAVSDADRQAWQQRREAWRAQNPQGRQGLTDEQRQARREAWQAQRQSQSQSMGQQMGQSQGVMSAPSGDPAGRGNRGGRGSWGRGRN